MSTEEPMSEFLSEIADQEVPSPDPAFIEHLDARLRIAHAESAPAPGRRARLVPALAVAALLVIGLVGTTSIRNQETAAVIMTVASDTSVYLDGGPVPGSAGLVLPDGARIVVGPTGEAVVDGVVLAAGAEAIVVDDRVTLVISGGDQQPTEPDRSTISVNTVDERANPRPAPTRATTGDGRPAGSPASSASETSATDRPLPDDDGRPTSTGPARTVAPDQTRAASTRPGSTSTTTVTSTGSSGTVPTSVSPGRITLTATDVGADRVRLDWVIDRDLAPMGWRIWTGRGDREATILVIRGGDARSATLERAAIVGRRVWIEAVDRSGGTVAASQPVSIG